MRTTVNIADETYQLASLLAKARNITLGEAIDELVNKAQHPKPTSRLIKSSNGFPLLPKRGGPVVTTKLIKELEQEEDEIA
jgi:hypothetical protein